jgi:hypothetical protein
MKKYILLILLFIQCFLLPAQSLEEVETFGLFKDYPPQARAYAACIVPNEYKTIKVEEGVPFEEGNDTFRIPKLHFVPAIYDTIGWDTVFVFLKHTYYRLKMNNEGDTSALHFWENDKEIRISAPVFETTYKRQNLVNPYYVWTLASKKDNNPVCLSASPDDCFVLSLKEMKIRKKFIYRELKTPAQIHIRQGVKDTTFALFPPSPYLEAQTIPDQYVYMPKLQKVQVARIDTTWEVKICPKESRKHICATSKVVLVRKGGLSELKQVICCGEGISPRTHKMIEAIQKSLKSKCLYNGKVDGELTLETRNALVEFQKARNLPQGRLDADTIKELGIDVEDFQED